MRIFYRFIKFSHPYPPIKSDILDFSPKYYRNCYGGCEICRNTRDIGVGSRENFLGEKAAEKRVMHAAMRQADRSVLRIRLGIIALARPPATSPDGPIAFDRQYRGRRMTTAMPEPTKPPNDPWKSALSQQLLTWQPILTYYAVRFGVEEATLVWMWRCGQRRSQGGLVGATPHPPQLHRFFLNLPSSL